MRGYLCDVDGHCNVPWARSSRVRLSTACYGTVRPYQTIMRALSGSRGGGRSQVPGDDPLLQSLCSRDLRDGSRRWWSVRTVLALDSHGSVFQH